jgi:hypothetical protein
LSMRHYDGREDNLASMLAYDWNEYSIVIVQFRQESKVLLGVELTYVTRLRMSSFIDSIVLRKSLVYAASLGSNGKLSINRPSGPS